MRVEEAVNRISFFLGVIAGVVAFAYEFSTVGTIAIVMVALMINDFMYWVTDESKEKQEKENENGDSA
jgi:sorbitol-specific phosphotransferase system component IIC